MNVLLSRVVDEHTQVMVEPRVWTTGNGWYPAKPSGYSVEISGNPPVFTRFFLSEINNFASCLGVAAVAEVDKEKGYWLR
jgi:hypothetical protein